MATVAQEAGVSKATVSYVLSGKRRISDVVSARVLAAVDRLGYVPDGAARTLASRRTYTIGLFCSPTVTLREDPYFNQLLSGILDALRPRGYVLSLLPEDESRTEVRLTLLNAVDGVLVMNPPEDPRGLEALRRQGVSIVVIGTPAGGADYFYVDHDQAALTFAATTYLIERGHRRMLYLNGPAAYAGSWRRTEGFRMALQERGIDPGQSYVRHGSITLEDGELITGEMLSSGAEFTAVLAMNDIISVGAIRALRRHGLRCPGDVAVAGSGDTIIAELHSPTLTSVRLAPYELGKEAGAMVIDAVERRRLSPTHTILPVTIVPRESA